MGDIVEITTIPKQANIYYKLTSGSLRFQVKGLSSAGIGFATTPYGLCNLWFILEREGYTTVTKDYKEVHGVPTPNGSTLSPREYKEFWLQWHDDLICLGNDYVVVPFITYAHKTKNLKYITFSAYNEYPLQWRIELPPVREQISIKSVDNGLPQWIPADGQLPDGALIGGHEGEFLYIIRAKHRGSVTPGKFVPSHGLGYIPWGGEAHEKNEIEVLCGYDCIWLPCANGRVPSGSVEAGYSEGSPHEPLYVGRAVRDGHLIPGKVQPSHKVCYIPYKEREHAVKQYEILVVPNKNVQCANPFFMHDYSTLILSASGDH